MKKSAPKSLDRLMKQLGLRSHPEGGAFAEHYRTRDSTAIYYLLGNGAISAWHRVDKDELWHHYQGSSVELHVITDDKTYERRLLGKVGRGDARPCQVVPAGAWQAARVTRGTALVGNTIAPAFHFSDWTLADDDALARLAKKIPRARAALRSLRPRPIAARKGR
jgi:predicted cupin superfamily sugar epimerase